MYNNNQWSKHLLFVVKQQLKAESNKHAESHTWSIKNSLRYNKANRKEKIGSWDERQNKQSQTLEEKRKEKQQLLSLTQKTFGKHTTVNKNNLLDCILSLLKWNSQHVGLIVLTSIIAECSIFLALCQN